MFKPTQWRHIAMFAAVLLSAASAPAFAQATRTWVSGVGDDVNPCSRTAPCKTFAGAISKTAAGGEINVIDPGGFGAVTITKSITIDGAGTMASILAAGSPGVTINGSGATGNTIVVTLRNLSINGAGTGTNGIRFLNGAALHVENVQVFGFTQDGISFAPTASSADLFVKDSIIRRNIGGAASGGILIKPTTAAFAQIDNTRIESNQAGVRVENGAVVAIRNSTISGNASDGMFLSAASSGQVFMENCLVASNGSGSGNSGILALGAGAVVRVSNNVLTDNSVGMSALGGGSIQSFSNNKSAGNGSNGGPSSTIAVQ